MIEKIIAIILNMFRILNKPTDKQNAAIPKYIKNKVPLLHPIRMLQIPQIIPNVEIAPMLKGNLLGITIRLHSVYILRPFSKVCLSSHPISKSLCWVRRRWIPISWI